MIIGFTHDVFFRVLIQSLIVAMLHPSSNGEFVGRKIPRRQNGFRNSNSTLPVKLGHAWIRGMTLISLETLGPLIARLETIYIYNVELQVIFFFGFYILSLCAIVNSKKSYNSIFRVIKYPSLMHHMEFERLFQALYWFKLNPKCENFCWLFTKIQFMNP